MKPILIIGEREIECHAAHITSRYLGDKESFVHHWEVLLDGFTDYELIRLSSPASIRMEGIEASGELVGFQLLSNGGIELHISPIEGAK